MYEASKIFKKDKFDSYSEFYLALAMSKILLKRGEVLDMRGMSIDYDLLPKSYIEMFKKMVVAKSIDIGSEIKESSVNMYEKLQCDIDISYFDEVPLFRDDGETLYWSIDIISKQYGKFSTRAYNMLNMGYVVSSLVAYHMLNIYDGKEDRVLVLDFDKDNTKNSFIYMNIVSCLKSMDWLNRYVSLSLDTSGGVVDVDYSIFCTNGKVAGHRKLWSIGEKLKLMEKFGMVVGSILVLWYRKGFNNNNEYGSIDRAVIVRLDEIGDDFLGITIMALNKTREEVYQDYINIDSSVRGLFSDILNKKSYSRSEEISLVGLGIDNYFKDEDKFLTLLDKTEKVYKTVTIDGKVVEVEMSGVDAIYWLLRQYEIDFDVDLYIDMYMDGEVPLYDKCYPEG